MRRMLTMGGLVLIGLLACRVDLAHAQSPAPSDAAVVESAPVDVPPPSAQALSYYRSGNTLWAIEQCWALLVPAVILFTGLSAAMRRWAARVGRKWFFTLAVYFTAYVVLTTLVDLPLDYYTGFVREHAYGLSNQTFGKWATDSLMTLAVTCAIGSLVVWVPYLLMKKSPSRWWLYAALALIPFIVAGNLVAPIWIAPLFNRFEPMQDKPLEAKILALASRAGIEGSRVFQVNKSVDTNTLNAYVAGLFGTKRIVLWDTIIRRMNERELLFVMGHEMGHYALGHVVQSVAVSVLSLLVLFFVVHRAGRLLLSRFSGPFGFAELSDIASLPLVILLANAASLGTDPFALAFERHIEHEADRFGLEITRTSHSAATAFIKLQTDSLSNPRPGLLFVLWRASHPPLGDRIDFANTYHPWLEGSPLRYGDRMTK